MRELKAREITVSSRQKLLSSVDQVPVDLNDFVEEAPGWDEEGKNVT
jgi:hypothetical protein